jgi:glucokinase
MTEVQEKGPILGVDVGGTKVAVGLVDRNGKILAQGRNAMVANGTAEAGLQAVAHAIDSLASTVPGGVHSIGICAPGPLDPQTGVVLNPPNLPCWRDFPLAERIASMYHVPVKVDNDANAAALAETRWGAARGYRYVFYATIGTGIGSGMLAGSGVALKYLPRDPPLEPGLELNSPLVLPVPRSSSLPRETLRPLPAN